MSTSKILAVSAALGLAAAGVLVVPPAHAVDQKQGIGSGRALVYIDSPNATVVKTGKHSYTMTLSPESSGQWMGERTDAAGNKRTRVGDITAKKLSNKWGNFRYAKAAVPATLAWVSSDGPSAALVKLSRPKTTDAGVRFDFTSIRRIPSSLTDVSINLQRAAGKGARSTDSYNLNITGDLWIGANYVADNEINTRVYNASNNNTCWTGGGAKVMKDTDSSRFYSVTSNTCANVAYENQIVPASSSDSPYGAGVEWPTQKDGRTEPGNLTYFLYVTPSGASQFKFTQQVMSFG